MLKSDNLKNPIKCILHLGVGNEEGKIFKFTEETFRKCNNAYNKRRQMKSKYNSITIPNTISDDIGYHCSCYKHTSVSLENAMVDSEIPTTCEVSSIKMAFRPNAINNVKSINNRTGVLEEKCIIYIQKNKKVSGNKQTLIVYQTMAYLRYGRICHCSRP